MLKKILVALVVLAAVAGILAFAITRDGELATPEGEGTVSLASGEFEAFPLPESAASLVGDDYKSYFVEVEPGIKIHILEVGEGFPVYMQHGNPTSGFLYRKVAAELPRDRLRLIMPTMVGLGYSSKVPASEHTLDNHMRWMNAALAKIGVTEAIYVGQDWGGPVGMGAMARSPDVLKGVVAMNTGFTAPKEKRDLSETHARVKTPVLGEVMIELSGAMYDGLANIQGDPASMPREVVSIYLDPVFDSDNAKAPLALMRMVPDGPEHPSAEQMREIETYVQSLDVPAEIVWGMRDPILGAGLSNMQENFPNARVTKTEAGHFLQEEVPSEIAAAILRVIEQVQDAKKAKQEISE